MLKKRGTILKNCTRFPQDSLKTERILRFLSCSAMKRPEAKGVSQKPARADGDSDDREAVEGDTRDQPLVGGKERAMGVCRISPLPWRTASRQQSRRRIA